jgi:hypothetical protein
MATITQGSSLVLTIGSGDSFTVESDATKAYTVQYPTGTTIYSGSETRTFGPYSGSTATVAAVVGSVRAEMVDGAYPSSAAMVISDPVSGGISIYGLVVVEGVVAGDLLAAALNTSKIQAALNTRGRVFIGIEGDVFVLPTLVIGSNTHLIISPKTTIRLAGGTGKNILQTSAYTRATTPVTVAWTSGYKATVTWTGHGLEKGAYVWLRGGSPSQFIGVFHIYDVTNANTFVVDLVRLPTVAPSGSWVACVADENITIDGGGIFDYDGLTNYTVANNTDKHALLLTGVAKLRVKDITVNNAHKYCFATGALTHSRFDNIGTAFNFADCIKFYGPCFDTHLDGLWGKTGDDSVTFQSQEGALYTQFAWTYGDILNCSVRNVETYSEHNTVGVFSSDNEYIDQVTFENIRGIAADTGANIGAQQASGFTQGNIGQLTFKNFSAVGATGGIQFAFGYYCNAKSVIVDGLQINGDGVHVPTGMTIQANATINTLTIRDVLCDIVTGLSGSMPIVSLSGTLNTLNYLGGRIKKNGSATPYGISTNASTLGEVNFVGVHFDGDAIPVSLNSATLGNPKINVSECQITGASQPVVNTSASCRVNLTGNVMTGISWGALFVPGGTPTIEFKASGNTMVSGSWVGVTGGTPIISVFGNDIKVAPNATGIARTAGSYCFNGTAGVGTLVQNNLVVCDATGAAGSWKQITDTTKNY